MKNATFFVMESESASDGLSAIEALVCDLAASRWRDGKRILIACEDEQQANRMDEALWQR
ncbi:DNA polymerase III subunit chi, partial [Klebsiella pneumoniae]|uniref:DNA polymerase III subunit chi n=1 Tax=Klebsiella pneumoniae TaxID=573 RepID=UPI003B5A2364